MDTASTTVDRHHIIRAAIHVIMSRKGTGASTGGNRDLGLGSAAHATPKNSRPSRSESTT